MPRRLICVRHLVDVLNVAQFTMDLPPAALVVDAEIDRGEVRLWCVCPTPDGSTPYTVQHSFAVARVGTDIPTFDTARYVARGHIGDVRLALFHLEDD